MPNFDFKKAPAACLMIPFGSQEPVDNEMCTYPSAKAGVQASDGAVLLDPAFAGMTIHLNSA
jgi:hypothetical protein